MLGCDILVSKVGPEMHRNFGSCYAPGPEARNLIWRSNVIMTDVSKHTPDSPAEIHRGYYILLRPEKAPREGTKKAPSSDLKGDPCCKRACPGVRR